MSRGAGESAAGRNEGEPSRRALRPLWLVADDYGIAPGVSGAIRDLLRRGRLNATTVMVVAPSFDAAEAKALAALRDGGRRFAVGLHLTLTAPFRPLTPGFVPVRDGQFPSLAALMAAAFLRRLHPGKLRAEITAQLAAFAAAFGFAPDFVDGHRHVHLLPQVRREVVAGVRAAAPRAWLRQCTGPGGFWRRARSPKAALIDWLSRGLAGEARAAGLAANPAFAGAYRYRPGAEFPGLFPRFLQDLPGESVVMCHPGKVDAELERLDPLTVLREREYAYFLSDEFPRVLAERGLTLEWRG